MGAGAAVGAIGGIAQGIMGQDAASDAAAAQAQANERAAREMRRQYDVGQKNLQPYMQAGGQGLNLYKGLVTGQIDPTQYIQNDPQFKAQIAQGTNALDMSAAAKGNLLSGGQMKAVQNYGQGLAAGQYQNFLGNLWNMANMGQNSAAGAASQGNQLAANVGQQYANAGSAQAAGIMGGQNATANMLGSLGQAAGQYQGFGQPMMGRGRM